MGFILLIGLALVPVERAFALVSQGGLITDRAVNSVDPATKTQVLKQYGNIPLHFEANKGQTDERVRFLCRGHGNSLFLTDKEAMLVLGMAQKRDDLMPLLPKSAAVILFLEF